MAAEPEIIRNLADLRQRVAGWRRRGRSIGLVPTMGALHAGHMALVDRATAADGRTLVSLFVNPKQFDRADDLASYPRTWDDDIAKLAAAGVDAVWAPGGAEMYPPDFATSVRVAGLAKHLCGAARPGHFDGVSTVVAKLLLQALPDRAYFGEKDFQQLLIVRRTALDLNIPVEIVAVPTVREPDGLALSSRNALLTPDQRRAAPALHRVLTEVAAGMDVARGSRALLAEGIDRVDYLEIRDAETLAVVTEPKRPARVFGAVFLGDIRLIDNIAVTG